MFTMSPYRRYMIRPASPVNSIFSDPFLRSFIGSTNSMMNSGFRVDIKENEGTYQIEAELPGLTEDQINLSMNEDTLTISADYQNEKEQEEGGRVYTERRNGHMERSFNLDNINKDGITASYKNGILYVNLPKEQPQEKVARKIPIQSEDSKKIEE
jgi:HSP20 family protein